MYHIFFQLHSLSGRIMIWLQDVATEKKSVAVNITGILHFFLLNTSLRSIEYAIRHICFACIFNVTRFKYIFIFIYL